jgi:predicted nucleotidyltransferase
MRAEEFIVEDDAVSIKTEGVAESKQPGQPVVDAILKAMPIAQEIWFHGSRAIGKHRKNSDTDILVVVPDDLVGDRYLGVVRILQKLSSHFDNYDIQPTRPGYNIHLIAQEEGRLLWSNKQGVAEGTLNEYRNALYDFVKSKFPNWPEYVLKDFLYAQAKGIRDQEELNDFLERNQKDLGQVKWRLEKLPITLDIFTPKTQQMITQRAGGSSNPMQVPKDAERHAQQLKMIQQQGVRTEPIIVAKLNNGYDLIEGWHRTIQHLQQYPEGYTGPAWVAYGATYTSESKQGVAEGFANAMSVDNMIAYLRQHHDENLHPDYLNHLTTTNSKFVLKNIPLTSIRTELAGLDRAKVEQYKKMDFSKAPPIVVGSDGNILDGYHRATVAKALGISAIKAYVGVNGQQAVAEGYSNTTFNVDRKKLNVPALIKAGAILVTHPHGEQGWETDNKEDWAYSLISLYNVLQGGWTSEAKKYIKPASYKRAEQQINSSAPNLGSNKLVYDGKYNQILWSIKKLGIPDNVAFLDNGDQAAAEELEEGWKDWVAGGAMALGAMATPANKVS